MDLYRDPVGPGPEGPLAGDRHAGLVEQRAARAGPRLGEPLCRAATPGEASIHQALGQVGHRPVGALVERLAAHALDVRDAVVDARRALAIEQVRGVHGVPAGAQLLGERAHPVGESLHVVEQHDVGRL